MTREALAFAAGTAGAVAAGAALFACASVLGISDVQDDPLLVDAEQVGGIALRTGQPAYTVRPGGSAAVDVLIDRSPGYSGPLTLRLAVDTAGVTGTDVTVAAGATTATVEVAATSTAPLGSTHATIRASGEGRVGNTASCVLRVLGKPGTLDATYGADGAVSIPLGPTATVENAAIDGEGRIVAVGSLAGGSQGRQAMATRIDGSGHPDAAFGVRTFDRGGALLVMQGVAIGPSGRIFTSGTGVVSNFNRFVAALDRTGTLDPSFGDRGVVTRSDLAPSAGLHVASVGDEVVAFSNASDLTGPMPRNGIDIDRYALDGGPGTPFISSNSASVSVRLPSFPVEEVLSGAAVERSGGVRFLLAAQKRDSAGKRGWLGAISGETGSWDGLLNPSAADAGGGGAMQGVSQGRVDVPALIDARAAALGPAGIAIVGPGATAGPGYVVMLRLPDGRLSQVFGAGGKVPIAIAQPDYVLIDGSGQIVVGGTTIDAATGREGLALARVSPEGVLDPTFGVQGVVTIPAASPAKMRALVLDAEGRYVVVAQATPAAAGGGDGGGPPPAPIVSLVASRVFP